jgi:hypothetical protein
MHISLAERRMKILRYWMKKRKVQTTVSKVKYSKRKKVADRRLRINGKFVSKKQAIDILGMSKKEFQK